jgi:alkylation response protein AidB-like acyl-CoA dehydrogenase
MGQLAHENLEAEGVEAYLVETDAHLTGSVAVFVDHTGERSMVSGHGADFYLLPSELPTEVLPRARHLHLTAWSFFTDPPRRGRARSTAATTTRGSTGSRRSSPRSWPSLGWIGLTWPKEFGGGARPADRAVDHRRGADRGRGADRCDVVRRSADGAGADRVRQPDQQEAFLPGILSGDTTWCIGMSEPNAGSDLASLVTSAVRDGDEFVINGQKIWTSFGAVADYMYLICRTSSDGPPHEGISEIIVPMNTPGIEVRPITDMTTNRHFCEVFFTDVRVPVTNLVGVEGAAFKQTMRQLEHERGGIDRLVSNHALYDGARARRHRRSRSSARRSPRSRRATGSVGSSSPGGARPGAEGLLGGHQVLLHRARVARRRVRDAGVRRRGHLWSDVVHGLLYAPGYTIMGGTSNVMRNILGERVLGLPREPR